MKYGRIDRIGFVAFTVFWTLVGTSTLAEERTLKQNMFSLLRAEVDTYRPGRPTLSASLQGLAEYHKVPMTAVHSNLIEFVKEGLTSQFDDKGEFTGEGGGNYFVTLRAIHLLAIFHVKEASGLLAKMADLPKNYRYYRAAVIPAVIQIGDTNMLDFAKEVCTNRTKWGSVTSPYNVLRELAGYADPSTGDSRRSAVIEFLLQYKDDADWGTVSAVDAALCGADEEYSRSHERQTILEKFKDAPFYYPQALKAIKALPAERRTHVDLKTLATKPPPVKLPVTNTPPVAPKGN